MNGAIGSGETPSAADIKDASEALNIIIKEWMVDGLQVWLQDEITIYQVKSKQFYELHATGDHATSSGVKTKLQSSTAAGATTLSVDSTAGMTLADNIGTEVAGGVIHWTTIAAVVDANTVTLTVGLPGSANAANHVFAYTTRVGLPYQITNIIRRDENNFDTPVETMSREEYMALSDKSSGGFVSNYFYDKQLLLGRLHVWPTTNNVRDTLVAYVQREVEDFDNAADDPDFPKYYTRALKFQLAADLGPEHGISNSRITLFTNIAADAKKRAGDYDVEDGSIYVGVDDDGSN